MASLSFDQETPPQTITRLRRELQHLSEQCQVAHSMARAWREKYRVCEAARVHLVKQLAPKAAKDAHTRQEEQQADIDARFGLFAQEEDAVDEAVSV